MRIYAAILAGALAAFASLPATAAPPEPVKTDVYIGGEGGYHTYRIPVLAITNQGTVLAFCEARKNSASDQGDIDLALKRSTDGGATWGPMQIVHEEGGDAPTTIGNPCPIVVHDSDTVHLLFTRDNKRLYYTQSADEGLHWTAPKELTAILKDVDFPWIRIASGPVHGLQLQNGRLVAPMWYCDAEPDAKEKRYRSGVIYAEAPPAERDPVDVWQAGGLVPETIPRLNECTVLERKDGSLLLNMRAHGAGFRATALSTDGGGSWSEPVLDPNLSDPTCQGSILRLAGGDVIFSNVPGPDRANLSLRLSKDDGETWSAPHPLETGPSAYSDLAQRMDGTILCFYERGTSRYNEKVTLARIDPGWFGRAAEKAQAP